MKYEADSPEEYISQLPEERKEAMEKLRRTIKDKLPAGYQETMSYGMLTYVVPHSLYPPGYHVNPQQPLPFISIASQKNFIALYHLGLYMYPELLEWFLGEYPKHVQTKLDMGKSCVRFKKVGSIPYDLIGELSGKITVEEYISMYETATDKTKKK
ncbi:hypothetical protein GCM10010912_55160 [Paenibacillus albidus]|uniref:YdhG-like domain-containing protein n=1 Tax=Paenibacillus albidus TaxID=2041023 RepID=A0A917CZ88_9BACL|nr:DUF1801 domain-containing protein [Paenibacillus albidus]MBT2289345.1 DUF1801 domain-containing protein [Paenibacillus albidus]GGG03450.1 hypothetical protein GCM10010912_55160 [Paenibacillus albidus]